MGEDGGPGANGAKAVRTVRRNGFVLEGTDMSEKGGRGCENHKILINQH